MTWIVPPCQGLIEPSVAPEIAVDGIGAIEYVNGTVRVYLYAEQMPLEAAAGEPGKILAVKLRGPIGSLPMIIGQLAQCLWRPGMDNAPVHPPRGRPHLVP